MAKTKTVLITGSGIRLGSMMALSFADNGWDVCVHYHRSEAEAEKLAKRIVAKKRRAILVRADLSDSEAASRIIPSLNQQGVTLDCLINNASVFEKDSLKTLNGKSFQKHMDVNLFAPLQLIRDFASQYKGKEGNVVNISDGITGWSMSSAFLSYALSKMSLQHATELLTRTLAPNIRINTIALGPTLEGVQDKKDTFKKLAKMIPTGSTSSPDEVIAALHYLLSSPSITGQMISLSGGIAAISNPA